MDNGRFGPIRTDEKPPQKYKINYNKLVTLLMVLAVVALGVYIVQDIRAKKAEPQLVYTPGTPSAGYNIVLPGSTKEPEKQVSLRPEAEKEGLLPIFYQANTEEKRVAITVDSLGDSENVNRILEVLTEYGAKATFFPTGDEIMAHANLWSAAVLGGHEIENHTNTNSRLALLGEDAKAEEIAMQTAILRDVIGMEYDPHFLRTNNLEDDTDEVLHALLKENGYYGIARWNCMAPTGIDDIRPGQIIAIDLSSYGVSRFGTMLSALNEAGYRMVTMNALFDYEENLVSSEGTPDM